MAYLEEGSRFLRPVKITGRLPATRILAVMGRPPLFNQRVHLNLPPEMLDRIDAIAGAHGRSKFARQAIGQLLDRLAPTDEVLGTDPFERDGGHEPRLSPAGTAAILAIIKKRGFDQVMDSLETKDPREFLFILLGHRQLPNRLVTLLAGMLIPR
jgi:hypothetical protein